MKATVVITMLLSSPFAFAGGGNTSTPKIATLAYIGCSDPNFTPHLNPNTLSISLSEVYETKALQPLSGKVKLGAPRVAGGGAFLGFSKENKDIFTGKINNESQALVRVSFSGHTANVEISEKSGQITNLNLNCTAFKSNGQAPNRFDGAVVPASVTEALAILQK